MASQTLYVYVVLAQAKLNALAPKAWTPHSHVVHAQAEFNALAGQLAAQYPDRARLWFAYDEPLSHLFYAGSDLFLVPSMFEPCGLTQMIAMRYALAFLYLAASTLMCRLWWFFLKVWT